MALEYSSLLEPLPPWKTRKLRVSLADWGWLQRFLIFAFELVLRVFLMFIEEFRVETDISGFVDTVDVSKASGNGEIRSNSGKCAVDIPDILRLSIQRSIINASVIHTYQVNFANEARLPSSSPPV